MNKFTIRVMPNDITGYTQTFTFNAEDNICYEKRCGNSRDSVTVTDKEYGFSEKDWEDRIVAFQALAERLNNTYGTGTAIIE